MRVIQVMILVLILTLFGGTETTILEQKLQILLKHMETILEM